MKRPVSLLLSLVAATLIISPSPGRAHPAYHESIEWATANSERVIVGKVIKAETVDKHDIVTVEVHRTLRGDQEPKANSFDRKLTFVLQQYCSGTAQGWLEDELPMIFFLVKIDGSKHGGQLPKGFKWVLHKNGNGNSAVALGKTNRVWPGTIDVFTRKFDYLTDPAEIVKFVGDYARSIPPGRIDESITVEVAHQTSAYNKVFPPEYPGNAFFLRLPVVEQQKVQDDGPGEVTWNAFMPLVIGAFGCCICIWYLGRRWLESCLAGRSRP
jgi:hypothetical protein